MVATTREETRAAASAGAGTRFPVDMAVVRRQLADDAGRPHQHFDFAETASYHARKRAEEAQRAAFEGRAGLALEIGREAARCAAEALGHLEQGVLLLEQQIDPEGAAREALERR